MTAACITFEQIEDRAENSLALAIWAKRVSATALAFVVGNGLMAFLATSLKNLDQVLTTEALERFSPEQLRDLASKLKELLPRLTRLCAGIQSSPMNKLLLPGLIKDICETAENLESALENIQFALRPEFHDAVSSAIDRLRLGAETSASMSR